MRAKRQSAAVKRGVVAALLIVSCALPAFPQNAPGVLPWAMDQSGAGAKNKKTSPDHRKPKGRKKGPARQAPRRSSWGLLQGLQGAAYFGLENNGSSQGSARTSDNANELGFSLEERGFLFDPRLWTHTLGVQMDRSAFNAPFQSTVTNGLGINFNGTLFESRSFPFRISFTRHRANTNFTGPAGTRTSFHNLGMSWSLNKPKLANVTLNALFGKTATDSSSLFAPFEERQQNFSGIINRSFHGWFFEGDAGYSRVRSSLDGYQYILREQGFRVQRPVGERGDWTTSLHRMLRSESDRRRPWTRYALTTLQSSLAYRHSQKLHGYYGANYLSNIREAAIASALLASTGQGGTGVVPSPALRQALLSQGGNSSFTGQAGWNYAATQRLSFSANLGQTSLDTQGIPLEDQTAILKSYTTAGGGVAYQRRFGAWSTSWRGSVLRNWNHRMRGEGYADNSRSLGLGVAHALGRWNWNSDISYSEYSSGIAQGTLHRQERWANSVETRFRRLNLNFGAELLHINSNYLTQRQFNMNGENGLLLHGTFTTRRWSATVGHGLRNVNSAILALDLANPLNTALLSEVNPLVSPFLNADRYTYLMGNYKLRRNLAFQGSYRRDRFVLPQGEFNRYTDMDLGLAYRLGKLTMTAGYRELHQETLRGRLSRNMVYVRIMRPFRFF